MEKYHGAIARRIRQRLYDALKRYTGNKFTGFSEWKFVFVPVPKQDPYSNDCAFFVMHFLEYYDGEKRKMDINPVSTCLLHKLF